MTSRSRERRRASRSPGIWLGPFGRPGGEERPAVQHGSRGKSVMSWRIVSALIVLGLSVVLFIFFVADAFYVHTIAVGGLRYLSKEEVFALTGVANMHIFWVDPAEVRASVLRSPTIADARVQVGWPPVMVQIIVEEREPALVWEQAGVAVWVDLQGRVMRQQEDRTGLVRVSADTSIEGPLGPNSLLETDVVNGALQLHTLYPDISVLRYNPNKGLGYRDGRGWDVWFGTGTNMPEKILIYNAIVSNLQSRGIQPGEINVVNPDAPFYADFGGR